MSSSAHHRRIPIRARLALLALLRLGSYGLLFLLARRLPFPLAYLLAWFVGWLAWWCDADGRKRVGRNLRPLLPAQAQPDWPRLIRRNYIEFTVTVFEQARMGHLPTDLFRPPRLRIVDPWGALRSLKGPAILVGPHVHWELQLAAVLPQTNIKRMAAIALSHQDERIDAWFEHGREAMGCQSLYLDRAPLTSLRWLGDGKVLGIVADRLYTAHGQVVPFAQGQLALPVGPAALAVQTGASIYPMLLARHAPTAFTLCLGEPIHPGSGSRQDQIKHMMKQLGARFGRFLMACPHQWCAFHEAWSRSA